MPDGAESWYSVLGTPESRGAVALNVLRVASHGCVKCRLWIVIGDNGVTLNEGQVENVKSYVKGWSTTTTWPRAL
jgi:hypothetical protein